MTDSTTTSTATLDTSTRKPLWVSIIVTLGAALVLSGVFQSCIGQVFAVPSGSMEPTLNGCSDCNNDKIYVNRTAFWSSSPQPGDVIVFKGPKGWETGMENYRPDNTFYSRTLDALSYVGLAAPRNNTFVKRVIATSGQTVSCQAGDPAIMVDGKATNTEFLNHQTNPELSLASGSSDCGGRYFGPIKVPEGSVFVVGDNRTHSLDSRAHISDGLSGSVPLDNVVGRVEAVIWPIPHISTIKEQEMFLID